MQLFRANMKLLLLLLFVLSFPLIAEEIKSNVSLDESIKFQQTEEAKQKSHFNFYVSAGFGLVRGNTTYQIGGHVSTPTESGELHFPISELVFPLEIYTANIKGSFEYNNKFRIETLFRKNITNKTGNMRDSDWGVSWEDPPGSGDYWWYGPDHLDIYSESKTEVNLFIFDVDFKYKFLSRKISPSIFSLYGGGGYRHQNYYFECRLIRQYDYRDAAPPSEKLDAVGDGSVGLTYEVTFYIPYLKLAPEIKRENVYYIQAGIGISPYTIVKDRDNHVLRSKISKGECDGYTILFSLTGELVVFDPVVIELAFDYISINTEGKQKQYTNGSWTATIDQKNSSKVASIVLSAGYKF